MNDKRTESVFIRVTPEVKREFDLAKTNESLQEDIIRRHIKSETSWLEDEMKEIDEAVIKYKAKLITIRDNFAKAQDSYIVEIEKIYTMTNEKTNKIESKIKSINEKIEGSKSLVLSLKDQIGYINTSQLERLLDAVDRYNGFNESQKELVKMLIKEG